PEIGSAADVVHLDAAARALGAHRAADPLRHDPATAARQDDVPFDLSEVHTPTRAVGLHRPLEVGDPHAATRARNFGVGLARQRDVHLDAALRPAEPGEEAARLALHDHGEA